MRTLACTALALWLLCAPAAACVGKTLVIGSLETPRGRLVAQLIAVLINERTGTTVKIADAADADSLHRALAAGEVDLAVEQVTRALGQVGSTVPTDAGAAYQTAKELYLERLNLVWLPPLGYGGDDGGLAAPVARKDTLKKFPALSRLIAKTEGILPEAVIEELARAGEPAKTARAFLRQQKLI